MRGCVGVWMCACVCCNRAGDTPRQVLPSLETLRASPSWPVIIMSHRNVQPHVSINEVACYRTERTLMGCTDPLRRGLGTPHQCSRVNEHRSDWGGESSLAIPAVITSLHCAGVIPLSAKLMVSAVSCVAGSSHVPVFNCSANRANSTTCRRERKSGDRHVRHPCQSGMIKQSKLSN